MLTNTGTATRQVDVAINTDIQIGYDDNPSVGVRDDGRAIRIASETQDFAVDYTLWGFDVTPVSTYWLGRYDMRQQNIWNQVSPMPRPDTDIGFAASWQDNSIPPHGSLTIVTMLGTVPVPGVFTLAITSVFSSMTETSSRVEISGSVSGSGGPFSIYMAIDDPSRTHTIQIASYLSAGETFSHTISFASERVTVGIHTFTFWAEDDSSISTNAVSFETDTLGLTSTPLQSPLPTPTPGPFDRALWLDLTGSTPRGISLGPFDAIIARGTGTIVPITQTSGTRIITGQLLI
jgi:hypothetical protein